MEIIFTDSADFPHFARAAAQGKAAGPECGADHLRLENYDDLTENEYVGVNSTTRKHGAQEPAWSVWRQDDNGNVFLVRAGLTEAAAVTLSRELEREGHKQTYWAKQEPQSGGRTGDGRPVKPC